MRQLGQSYANLGDLVIAEIRAAILGGDLAPGQRLTQEQLAADLGVSRIPVREALRVLEAEGLVEARSGRGVAVVEFTRDEAADILTVRGALEGLAARLAAAHMSPDDVAASLTAVREGRLASERGDHALASVAHTRFHLDLVRATGNSQLRSELETMPATTEWIVSGLLKSRAVYSWQEHEQILDAVAARDGDRAEKLMLLHSERVIAALDDGEWTADDG